MRRGGQGHLTEVSPGSARGQCFVVGDGRRLSNTGQRSPNLETLKVSTTSLMSRFPIARVTRPLMSVGKICDNGMKVEFDDVKAVVRDSSGFRICCFERKPDGLYTDSRLQIRVSARRGERVAAG